MITKLITILIAAMYTLFMGMFLVGELFERKNKWKKYSVLLQFVYL
jgi:hypothetical protein